jgi:hypothetical protein
MKSALLILAFVVGCVATQSSAQVALLNSCSNSSGSTAQTTISCTIATTHANSLIVVRGFECQQYLSTGSCQSFNYSTSATITDTKGLVYTQRAIQRMNICCEHFSIGVMSWTDAYTGATSGTNTFTLTDPNTDLLGITVFEFSNIVTSNYYDVTNTTQLASICSVPGGHLTLTVSPTQSASQIADWNVNISCIADGGAAAIGVSYFTTLSTEVLMAWGLGGNFTTINGPFTQVGGDQSFGIFEEALSPGGGLKKVRSQVY